jgi:hypothetical protein
MQIWQDGCYRRAEIASFTASPINRGGRGNRLPADAPARVLLQPKLLRLLSHLVLVPGKEPSGFRHRPAVGDFVRHVTDVHCGPGSPEFCVLPRWPCMWHKRPDEHCPFPRKTRMALTLRPTGMSSPASKEPVEFLIYDDAEEVGRIYKIGGIGTPPDGQWSWSITVYVDPMLGIATSAKVATLEEAKAQLRQNWERAKAHSRAYGRSGDADKAQGADT